MKLDYFILVLIIAVTIIITVRLKKLTLPAAVTGGIIGLLIFKGGGFTAIAMMAAFFILGTAATSWKSSSKHAAGIAEANEGRRTASQVIANAGLAAILAIMILVFPERMVMLRVMTGAAFSAATADTISSELGNVYGSRYYNIISFRKDLRGENGVISMEGSLAGLLASGTIAGIFSIGYGWSLNFLWILVAGTIGNLADSVLGATIERRQLAGNNMVNFLNTCVAALTAMGLYHLNA